tara:strand:+ start:462 stop:692 length:231 start_codon:yes stop_codon:yes gene_type:complete
MNDFLKDVIKETGNEYAAVVSEGVEAGDVENFIDTGSYIFNGLISWFTLWWTSTKQNNCSRWRKCDRKNFLSYGNG